MSSRATQYARGLRVGPDGKPLSSAERRVLEALAFHYNDDLQYAFRKMGELAAELHCSPTYCRRVIAALEQRGMVTREAFRDAKGWQTSNNIRIPALVVSKTPAEEIDAERRWLRSFRAPLKQQLALGVEERAQGFAPATAELESKPVGCVTPSGYCAVESVCVGFGRGETLCVGPGETLCVGPYKEGKESMKVAPPKPPSRPVDCAKPSPNDAVEACLVMGKASEASAEAKATAKAERGERASRERGAGGGAGASSVGRRGPQMDHIDSAWELEVSRVLFAIDVDDVSTGRQIARQLQIYVEKHHCSIADAGLLAEQRWKEFNDPAVRRAFYPKPRDFFRHGLWLRPQAWTLHSMWLRELQDINPNVGRGWWRN